MFLWDSEQNKCWPSFPGRSFLLVFNDNEKKNLDLCISSRCVSHREARGRAQIRGNQLNAGQFRVAPQGEYTTSKHAKSCVDKLGVICHILPRFDRSYTVSVTWLSNWDKLDRVCKVNTRGSRDLLCVVFFPTRLTCIFDKQRTSCESTFAHFSLALRLLQVVTPNSFSSKIKTSHDKAVVIHHAFCFRLCHTYAICSS